MGGGGGPMFALANKLTRKFCIWLWSWRSLLGSNEEKYYDLVQIDSCLYCVTSPVLMITLQLLGHLDHLRRVHVRHREDHVEDQGDPHRRHRCQCSCRRDWGVQFVFFHIHNYLWFLNDSLNDMIDRTFIISSLFILTLNVFYKISISPGACVERHRGQSHLDGSRWKSHSSLLI